MIENIEGVGVDIEETNRFKKKYAGRKFLNLVFSKRELDYCNRKKEPYISLAGKFCAKEAVVKALKEKVYIKDIEIINSNAGKVEVYLNKKRVKNIYCSISHTRDIAIAFAIIECRNKK